MRIFTKDEAESVTKYYSEILIGKPIMPPGNSNPYPISSLKTTKAEEGYLVKCLSKYMNKTMSKDLEIVISELNILPLDKFLSNLD
ncbi:hypothetical protein SAMN04488062_103187 [Flavobacterium omnivorum]|uniref:Uncharacterized protein n=1 Tax=Flavobacterium omnivorum TaxID=178355 RepID=A0A1G7YFX9_9FLAO|nr:hypothetical protein [Flavobacterium omnivorum]SDG95353.1 hypothetical protein SAMN04488062_103187 [Flavobacterium omnivorum]